MIRILKYYKPFLFVIIISVFLLFIQAMCELKLPDYMADIVNIGIQTNGIEEVTPKAITKDGLELMKKFMTDENKKLIDDSYSLIKMGDIKYLDEYPKLSIDDIYVLKDEIKKDELNNIFSVSANAFILFLNDLKQDNNVNGENKNNDSNDMNASEIYKILPLIDNFPNEKINEYIINAEKQNDDMSKQIALNFTKIFYEELGVNIGDVQIKYIFSVGTMMLGIALIGITATILVDYLAAKIGAGVSRNLRKKVFEKVESFSTAEFNKFSEASLITRTTNDITQIQNVTAMGIRMLVFPPVMGVGALIMMLNKTTEMTWILGLVCGIIFIGAIFMFRLVLPRIKLIQKLTDKLNLVFKENLSGIMVIRAFGTQKHEEKRFDDVNSNLTKTNLFVGRAMSFIFPIVTLIMNLLSVLIIWVGAHQIAEATIQVGDLMAMLQYAMHVIISFLFISMVFVMIPRASVSAERIADVLETENIINNPESPKEFDKNKIGYVEFKNVDFKYEDGEELVLKDINFVAKPGETTAIIGSTGSGKSTLVKLILRFFDVSSGEILVNGVNVKEVMLNKLRSTIGYIPQKAGLLSGTIESNLKYGNINASDELMKKSAEIAQAIEFIEDKEEKYESNISQGAKNVSGGQKQRLSIARALVTEAPILIFDDSFSALDFKTDSKLRSALRENNKNSTVLIVAQRVSTIMNADQIIVLDQGKIVGIGKHSELLKTCETYKEIVYSQLNEEEMEGKNNA